MSSTSRCRYTVAVTVKQPRLKVGSIPATQKLYGLVQKRSRPRNCWSVAVTAIGSGAHVTSRTHTVPVSAILHFCITVNGASQVPCAE